jgi:hypothetical protein
MSYSEEKIQYRTLGKNMSLVEILNIKDTSTYGEWETTTILSGFVSREDINIEDKIKATIHIGNISNVEHNTEADAINFIKYCQN